MSERLSLPEGLFPVQAFFNVWADQRFVNVVEDLVNRIAHEINDVGCTFPEDLDPSEEPFDGVEFHVSDEQVIVAEDEFRRLLRLACDAQVRRVPEQDARIEAALARLETSERDQ
jgi:hypothetical protein